MASLYILNGGKGGLCRDHGDEYYHKHQYSTKEELTGGKGVENVRATKIRIALHAKSEHRQGITE